MLYIFYIIVTLAALHFVYDGILVPSFRLKLRFKLFKLRDELRRLKIDGDRNANDPQFRLVEDVVNNAIRLLHRTDIATVLQASNNLRKDPKLHELIHKRWKIFEECFEDRTFGPILRKTNKLFLITILINNGVLALFLLPLILLLIGLTAFGMVTTNIYRFLVEVVYVPENQFDRIMPADSVTI